MGIMNLFELRKNNIRTDKDIRNIASQNNEIYLTVSRQVCTSPSVVLYIVEQMKKGSTVPFLARYRRDQTGNMDDECLRRVIDLTEELRELNRRRAYMLKNLNNRGLLTEELVVTFTRFTNLNQLEDAWEVFKERKKLAQRGREAGLALLATKLLHTIEPVEVLSKRLREITDGNKLFMAIIVEDVRQCCELREIILVECKQSSVIHSTIVAHPRKSAAKELSGGAFNKLKGHFERYDDRRWGISHIDAHTILALQRGENKGVLSVKMIVHNRIKGIFSAWAREKYVGTKRQRSDPAYQLLWKCLDAAYDHVVNSAHNAIRRDLKRRAEEEAIAVFSHGLRHTLLQCPMREARVLAMDPGFTHGVKCVALDENGGVLTTFKCSLQAVNAMKERISDSVAKLQLNKIVIGNGTASREVADIVADTIEERELCVEYAIVSEAGASVYSISDVAKEEFPTLDAMYRGAVSIGRRVIDPLSELVKIPVRSMGIGMYQHDVSETQLLRALHRVVESCVASVGVNVMSSNRYMMEKIPGITKQVVDEIILARDRNALTSREDLRQVHGVTREMFQQIAGFFRFPNSPNPPDRSNIHPESYSIVQQVIDMFPGKEPREVGLVLLRLSDEERLELASNIGCGSSTLSLIANELASPALDPRSELPHVGLFRRAPRRVSDMKIGDNMIGVVQNVTTFGVFVDVGLHDNVLVYGLDIDAVHPGSIVRELRYEGCDELGRVRARHYEKSTLQCNGSGVCESSAGVTEDPKLLSVGKAPASQIINFSDSLLGVREESEKNIVLRAKGKCPPYIETKSEMNTTEVWGKRKRLREGDQTSLTTDATLTSRKGGAQGSRLKQRRMK